MSKMITKTDIRMLKEAYFVLRDRSEPINLQDLHEYCAQGKAHKTIREYGSIIRLKGAVVSFVDGDDEIFIIDWKEGASKMIGLSSYPTEVAGAIVAVRKRRSRLAKMKIEV